ncbi:MAG: hypothetical protein A2V70_09090 [Planctomycetes bacterium RBG_13_63_9]|nr:MAG: hypothetical protein A2V70_09090 [Planctomycetes bacterium RBG_13_63_9]
MQRILHLVVPSVAAFLALAVCLRGGAAQQDAGWSGYEQLGRYGPTPPVAYRPPPTAYRPVPGPPTQPMPASRPQSWPGVYPGPSGPPRHVPRQTPPAAAELEPCEGALILAKVGPEVILASELVASIDGLVGQKPGLSGELKEKQIQALSAEVIKSIDELATRGNDRRPPTRSQLEREALIRQLLKLAIETKLIYHDAMRTIPEENHPDIKKKFKAQFEDAQLPKMMEEAGVQTRQELDRKLRARGTSLYRQRQAFMERILAQTWIRQHVKAQGEITYDQMVEYYRNHLDEFEKPARARWEELMARFSKHGGKEEAGAAIARMGNLVASGVPLAQAAKAHSNGLSAAEGGIWEWTTRGSLVSDAVDRVLFELPVGQLSPILESEEGFHVIRVIEREESHCTPFLEAQVDIEPKIRQEQTKEALLGYVARLKEEIPVWTIFDDRPQDEQVSDRRGRPQR